MDIYPFICLWQTNERINVVVWACLTVLCCGVCGVAAPGHPEVCVEGHHQQPAEGMEGVSSDVVCSCNHRALGGATV